ncbi:hypothetical protein NC651_014382 [Populus alba x Populus x berolinensis]|nr:hypothetical protein NC651_014382 [Populus alba x Populus x berolinensis]
MLHACIHAAWHMDDETLGYGHSSKIHGFKILMSVLIHFANVKWTQNDLLISDGHDFSFFLFSFYSHFLFQISFFTWTGTEPFYRPSFGYIN